MDRMVNDIPFKEMLEEYLKPSVDPEVVLYGKFNDRGHWQDFSLTGDPDREERDQRLTLMQDSISITDEKDHHEVCLTWRQFKQVLATIKVYKANLDGCEEKLKGV